jgi:hypothetical protein
MPDIPQGAVPFPLPTHARLSPYTVLVLAKLRDKNDVLGKLGLCFSC